MIAQMQYRTSASVWREIIALGMKEFLALNKATLQGPAATRPHPPAPAKMVP